MLLERFEVWVGVLSGGHGGRALLLDPAGGDVVVAGVLVQAVPLVLTAEAVVAGPTAVNVTASGAVEGAVQVAHYVKVFPVSKGKDIYFKCLHKQVLKMQKQHGTENMWKYIYTFILIGRLHKLLVEYQFPSERSKCCAFDQLSIVGVCSSPPHTDPEMIRCCLATARRLSVQNIIFSAAGFRAARVMMCLVFMLLTDLRQMKKYCA